MQCVRGVGWVCCWVGAVIVCLVLALAVVCCLRPPRPLLPECRPCLRWSRCLLSTWCCACLAAVQNNHACAGSKPSTSSALTGLLLSSAWSLRSTSSPSQPRLSLSSLTPCYRCCPAVVAVQCCSGLVFWAHGVRCGAGSAAGLAWSWSEGEVGEGGGRQAVRWPTSRPDCTPGEGLVDSKAAARAARIQVTS